MVKRRTMRIGVAAFAALLIVTPALAQPVDEITVSGPTDYDALPPSIIFESVTTNEIVLTFPPAGGEFNAFAVLELFHDVPSQGCSFASFHTWDLGGDFDPATLLFTGMFIETSEDTGLVAGECDNFSFVRTFDNDAGEFTARLDPVAGTIRATNSVEPLFFTLTVDPALVADLVPATTTRPPVDPDATTPGDTQNDPSTTPGDAQTDPGAPQTDQGDVQTDPSVDPVDATGSDSPVTPDPVDPGEGGTIIDAVPTPPDASDGGGGLGLPLLLLLVVLVLIVLFFIFKMLTRTPSGPLPAAGGPATDSDTPFTDPMRGGSMPVTSSELEQVPTAPPDLGLTRPVTGTPVTSDELEQIPTVPPDFSQPDGPAGTPIPAGGPVPGGRLDPVGAPIPGGPDSGEEGTDCGPLEKAYREARDACDDAGAEADRIGEEFDKAEKRIEQAEADLADLPSEETRVELPDGTSLSQLDLHLRRQAAGAAWDAYMADPTPETARAAEDAWNEQATPEWLDEQRAAHQAEKDRITDRLDTAKQDKEQAGRDLTEARDRQQEACDEAAAAKRKLDECKKAAEEEARRAAEEAKKAEEEARRAEEEARRAEEERRKREEEAAAAPPPQPVPSTGGDGERSSKCREGATRPRTVAQESFKAFGGSENDSGSVVVRVKMLGKSSGATSDRTISGGMGDDGLSFPPPKEPKGIDSFMQLTAGSLSETVDRLIDAWDGLGTSGQFLYISFEATVAEVWVSCVEEEVCVNGEWKRRHRETKQDWTARSIETEPRLIRRVDGDTKATLTKIILDFKAKLEPYAQGRAQIEEFRRDCLTGSP